jgi:hypothetical protein
MRGLPAETGSPIGREAAEACRLALGVLRDSPIRSDRALAAQLDQSCRSLEQVVNLCRQLAPESPECARAEKVREDAQAAVERNLAAVTQRAAKLAEETSRQRERRRRVQDARKRERGMTAEQRERYGRELRRRLDYSVARRHGASHLEARRFSLGLPLTRQGSAVQVGRERRGGTCTRRRGSRRATGGGDRASPGGDGSDDDGGDEPSSDGRGSEGAAS